MAVGDDGSFAFACDTTAPEDSDQIVARWAPAAGFELMAREGEPAAGQPPGVTYSGGLGTRMLADGRVVFSSGLMGAGEEGLFLNSAIDEGTVLLQTGLTVPEDQTFPGTPLDNIGAFEPDASGDMYYYTGRLENGHDIVAVNNAVVAERDRPLPGGYPGFFYDPDNGDDGGCVSPYNAHYAFRCIADLGAGPFDEVVIVDGRVVAATGQPIIPGHPEVFTGFSFNVVNSDGDYLVYGFTNLITPNRHVMVLNGRTIVRRTHDPVDVNGDGLPNDGVLVTTFDPDSAFLTETGRVYFTGNLGSTTTKGFMWMRVPKRADNNCDGAIDFFDIDPFLLALFDEAGYASAWPECWRITADVNRDGAINFFDIDPFIACLFGACP